MQELVNRQTAPIVGRHYDLACPQSILHLCQGIICRSSGVGNRPINGIGTQTAMFAGRPDKRNWNEMFVRPGFDQLGDPRRLRSVT